MSRAATNSEISLADDAAWSSRCWFWQDYAARNTRRRAKRERQRQPLILSGHGVSLRIEGGTLLIRNGFTHYPQKAANYRFFRGDLDLPERIILIDGTGSISFDVLSWLDEQGVAFVRINWRGEISCVIGTGAYSANPFRLQWQRETRADPKLRMEFCNALIAKKIDASIITLEKSLPRSDNWEKAMRAAYATLTTLEENPPRTVDALRIIEGNAAAAYFRAWRGVPIKWTKRSRRPVPAEWGAIGQRVSPLMSAGNRNAAHPVNAILNYAYTALQSDLQIKAVADGYDPTLGIMHEGRAGSSAFIFDVMEPERPAADRKVLKFISEHTFDATDFIIRADGVCRLNPELARCVASETHRT